MFERYTEEARRCIFFALHEANSVGSPCVEVDHLVLGTWREDKDLVGRIVSGPNEKATISDELRALRPPSREITTSMDLPLSNSLKRVLAYAAEEAEELCHKHIGTAHLMLGVLREPSLANDILQRHDLSLDKLRGLVANALPGTSRGSASSLGTIQQEFQMLTGRLTHDIEPASIYRLP